MPEYIDREKIRLEVCSDCTRHVSLVCQNPEPCYKLLAAFLEAKPVDVAPGDGALECDDRMCEKSATDYKALLSEREGGGDAG